MGEFVVSEEVRSEHLAACRELLSNLRANKHATLAGLFDVLRKGDRRFGCGPEVIIHLGIDMNNPLPVPTLDLRTPERTGRGGLHSRFQVGLKNGKLAIERKDK